MGITFNSQEFNELYYNDNQVGQVTFNGDIVWKYAPEVPSFTITVNNDTSISLNWGSLVRDAVRYRIDYGTTSSFGESLTTQNAGGYTFTGLTPNTTYYFKIRAEGTWDNSEYSSTRSDTTPPATPVGFAGSTWDTDSIYLSWTASAGATRYYIDRRVGSGGSWSSVTYSSTNSYTDNGLSVGSSYSYRIRAYNSNGFSSYSAIVTASTGTVPSTTSISTVPSLTSISLSWIKVLGADGYQLQRSTSSNSGFSTVATISSGSTVSYNNTGLPSGTRYYYRIRAFKTYSGDDAYSSWSSVVNVTTLFQISVPSGLSLSTSENQVTANWNNVADETGFLLEIATNSAFTANLQNATLGINVTTHTFTGLSYETTYYVRIKAKGLAGVSVDSAYSSHATITTEADKLPAPILTNIQTNDDFDASYHNYTLNFPEVPSPADRIEYEFSDSDTFSNIIYTTVTSNLVSVYNNGTWSAAPRTSFYTNSYGSTWLAGGRTVYARIRAVDTTGNEETSNWSNVVSVVVPVNVANRPTIQSVTPIGTTGADATIVLNNTNPRGVTNAIKVEYSIDSAFSSSAPINDLYNITSRVTGTNRTDYSTTVYWKDTWNDKLTFNMSFPVTGQTYYMRFKHINTSLPECDSPWSATTSFAALTPANTPSATSTGNTTNKVVVDITGSSGSNEYFEVELYEDQWVLYGDSIDSAPEDTLVKTLTVRASGTSATANFYYSDGVRAGMTYYAKVRQARGTTYSVSTDFIVEEILTPHQAPLLLADHIKYAEPRDSVANRGDYTYVNFSLGYDENFSSESLAKYGEKIKGTSGVSSDLKEAPISYKYGSPHGAFTKMGALYEDYSYNKSSFDLSYSSLGNHFNSVEGLDSLPATNNDADQIFLNRYSNTFAYKDPYTVQVATDSSFNNIIFNEDLDHLLGVTFYDLVEPGQTYYVRARVNPIPVSIFKFVGSQYSYIRRRIGGTSAWSTTYQFTAPAWQSLEATYFGGKEDVEIYINAPARVEINWGDGSAVQVVQATTDKLITHNYGNNATYNATIEGVMHSIQFKEAETTNNDYHYLQSVSYKDDSSDYVPNNKTCTLEDFAKDCRLMSSCNMNSLDTSINTSCYRMFENCQTVVYISGTSGLVKQSCTNIARMFYGCSALSTVMFTNWETNNVRTLSEVFKNCVSLTTLHRASGNFKIYKNVNEENTKITVSMFENCQRLSASQLAFCNTDFDLYNVFMAYKMFKDVGSALTSTEFGTLDLSTMVGTFSNYLVVHFEFAAGNKSSNITLSTFPASSCDDDIYCWI